MVRGIPYVDCSYCQYGEPYRKNTRIWTNHPSMRLATCTGAGRCSKMVGRRHEKVFGGQYRPGERVDNHQQLSKVPYKLAASVAQQSR